jgi:arylformamidase
VNASGEWNGRTWRASLAAAVAIAQPIEFAGTQTNAFHLPRATQAPVRAGQFVGSTRENGPVNCRVLSLAPHGNGTHTETVSHIAHGILPPSQAMPSPFVLGSIVSVEPRRLVEADEHYVGPHEGSDSVLCWRDVESALCDAPLDAVFLRATDGRYGRDWSASRPPYPTTTLIQNLVARGATHLLLDVPSVDRDEDDGLLSNHHIWWGLPPNTRELGAATRSDSTITELCAAPRALVDGPALFVFGLPPLGTDAVPSSVHAIPLSFEP